MNGMIKFNSTPKLQMYTRTQIDIIYDELYNTTFTDLVNVDVHDEGSTATHVPGSLNITKNLKGRMRPGSIRLLNAKSHVDIIRHDGVFPNVLIENVRIIYNVLLMLQKHIHNVFGQNADIYVTNSLRLPGNSAAKYSRHNIGLAADIFVPGVSIDALRREVIAFADHNRLCSGVIMYENGRSRFVHFDLLRTSNYYPTIKSIPA